jgi:hypothetical protein
VPKKPFSKFTVGIGIASQAVGMFFLGVLFYYLWRYTVEAENPYRSELLIGAGFGYWFAMCAFACASVFAYLARKRLAKLWYRLLFWPGVVLVAPYGAALAYGGIMHVTRT